ncbi:hypothetical protein CBL_05104 [Carabus blaptoides fortunei]
MASTAAAMVMVVPWRRSGIWKDNRIVYFASNYHGTEATTTLRTQKDGTRHEVACPIVVKDYNVFMGGVDKADQLRTTYGMNRKSRKWWHRLFWGFLDIAFINAYIIYCIKFENISTLEFRRAVTLGLLSKNNKRKKSTPLKPITKRRNIIIVFLMTCD